MEFGAEWLKEAIIRHEIYKGGEPTGTVKLGNALALVDQADFETKEKEKTNKEQLSLDIEQDYCYNKYVIKTSNVVEYR